MENQLENRKVNELEPELCEGVYVHTGIQGFQELQSLNNIYIYIHITYICICICIYIYRAIF